MGRSTLLSARKISQRINLSVLEKIRLSKYWALLFQIIQLKAFSIDWTWKLKKRILGILAGK